MVTLTFEFHVPNGTSFETPLVSGALDTNRDGRYSELSEGIVFARVNDKTWRGSIANVAPPLADMSYMIHYTVGPNVAWTLRVFDDQNVLRGGSHGVSMLPSDFDGGILA
jgi:hypothetical protein